MLPLLLLAVLTPGLPPSPPAPAAGVSEALARERAGLIRSLRYDLHLAVPEDVRQPVRGQLTVRFVLAARHDVVLDFAQPRERVLAVRLGGRAVDVPMVNGHLIVPAEATSAGKNEIAIEF